MAPKPIKHNHIMNTFSTSTRDIKNNIVKNFKTLNAPNRGYDEA
jgi:hypothetical protein